MASGLNEEYEERCGEGDCCAMRGAVADSASAAIGPGEARAGASAVIRTGERGLAQAQVVAQGRLWGGGAALPSGQGSAAWRKRRLGASAVIRAAERGLARALL